MEKTSYTLTIVTPEGPHATYEKVAHCSMNGKSGEIGVYPDHSPAIFELNPSEVRVKLENGENKSVFIPSGILHVNEEQVSVLVPFVETVDQIDANRAKEAKSRAQGRIDNSMGMDLIRAEQSLLRAQERLFIIEQKSKQSQAS